LWPTNNTVKEKQMKYSIIVPVFNRPDEVDELVGSLCRQTCKDFSYRIIEAGYKTRLLPGAAC
jgi:GT2 family glycosyltransferase